MSSPPIYPPPDEPIDVELFLSSLFVETPSHHDPAFVSPETDNPQHLVETLIQQTLQQKNHALSATLATITVPILLSSGVYCPIVPHTVPKAESTLFYRRDTPFTNPKFIPQSNPNCNHTPKDIENAETTIKYLNIALDSVNSPKYSFAQLPGARALSHSLYFDRLCRILYHMYRVYGNGRTSCEVCFYDIPKLSKITDKYPSPLNVHDALMYAVWNCSHYSEFGLWKARCNASQPTFAQSTIGWVDALDTESDQTPPGRLKLLEHFQEHPDSLLRYEDEDNHCLHHHNHDCEDNEHILGCFTRKYVPLQSPNDVMDLYDVHNSTCYIYISPPPKFHHHISFITVALNCQNYDAFDLFLFKSQDLYGYVNPSVLYDILECQEYDLYNYITNYNQKLVKSIQSDIIQSPHDKKMVEKYYHITIFIPQRDTISEEKDQIVRNENIISSRMVFLPTNPITYQTTISLITTQIAAYAQNPNPIQLSYLISLLYIHINLARTTQSPLSTLPPAENSTAAQYLQQYYPQIIPFHNIMHPASIAYLSSKHLYSTTHISPSDGLASSPDAKVNPLFRPVMNEFMMSRFAAHILTKYLWLIEILALPSKYIVMATKGIPNFPEILSNITMKEFYTILLHQPIFFIAKWIYILTLFAPNYLRDISSQQSYTPRNSISSFNQSYANSSDRDLLATLLSDFLRYAIGLIFPLIWVQDYGWCYTYQKEADFTFTNQKRNDFDLSMCVFTQNALNLIMVFYTHPDSSCMAHKIIQARVSSSFPSKHSPILHPDDIILLRQITASLFFPVVLPIYNSSSDISNLTGDNQYTSFNTSQPLLDPRMHLDLFGINEIAHHHPHWARSKPGNTTVRSLMSADLRTFVPSLWCFLLNHFVISPLCRVKLPVGTQSTDDLQLALKSSLISHVVRLFLMTHSGLYNGYCWTFLMRCNDFGNDIDHNMIFEPIPMHTMSLNVTFISHADTIICSRRISTFFPQYKDICTAYVNFLLDDIIISRVILSVLTESIPSRLLSINIPSTAILNNIVLKLYIANISRGITNDPRDYYANLLKTLKLDSVEEFHRLVSPYCPSEIENGTLALNTNAKLPSMPEHNEEERNNSLSTPLLNPFASLLYQYQPILYAINTLGVPKQKRGMTQLGLDQLFHLYKDFINVEIDLCEFRTPIKSSFAQHILTRCCNVDRFAQIPPHIYQQFLLPAHNDVLAVEARERQLQGRLVSYRDDRRLSARFDLRGGVEAPPSLFLFLLKALSIPIRSIMMKKGEYLIKRDGLLPLNGLFMALLEACVNECTSKNQNYDQSLIFFEKTFTTHYDNLPISRKQYGEVFANCIENKIDLVLKEYESLTLTPILDNIPKYVRTTPKLFYRTYSQDLNDISSKITTVIHPITREQISLNSRAFITKWDLKAIFTTLEMERTNGTVFSIIKKTQNIPPLSLFNSDHTGINPIFSKIDTIEKFWLYYCSVDPLIKPFFENAKYFCVDPLLPKVVD